MKRKGGREAIKREGETERRKWEKKRAIKKKMYKDKERGNTKFEYEADTEKMEDP